MRGVGREHPCVAPASCPFGRDGLRHLRAGKPKLGGLVRSRGADDNVPVLEQRDLVAGCAPVLIDQRPLLLQQSNRRVELLLSQLVWVFDSEVGLRLHEVKRGVGDLDGVVGHRHKALVGRVV